MHAREKFNFSLVGIFLSIHSFIDVWLNAQALFDPVFKWYLPMTLKLINQIKATQGITGLIIIRAQIKLLVWNLDVGLSSSKIVLDISVGLS